MRIHYIQNDELATLGYIEEWVKERNHSLTCTRMYNNEVVPSMQDFDMLIILGGRMGAYEEADFPWLVDEKHFIREAIEQKKKVLGICLGAQLLAEILGGRVYPHTHQEIGWWPIRLEADVQSQALFDGISESITAFQFHGDTYDLPTEALRLASSRGCKNQAFSYEDHVIGLQFHPEFTHEIISVFEQKLGSHIPAGEFIQEPKDWINQDHLLEGTKTLLFTLLTNFEAELLKVKV
ncbi:type 1 glutamine amidotransferase [Bacillus sp. S3]|uniref:type 1 glutamine amidotransferase n=1 Tax=Bacillus sp. S3 TaxID=486398 RepID=UPI001187E469|nr:type 1 glutamine amidotransferase [Bacillus sp. S3]QCJ41797.1 type 1 glutamine amidotransferase [Bacillus sp. S3]